MRTLLRASCLGLLSVAALHCSADGTGASADGNDEGATLTDASSREDAAADPLAPDADAGDDMDAGPCSAGGWCKTSVPKNVTEITAVWSFASDEAIATTRANPLRWDGTTWKAFNAPELEGLTSLWATSPNDIWGVAQYEYRLVHGTRAKAGDPFVWSTTELDSDSPSLDMIRGNGERDLWVYGTRWGEPALRHGVISTPDDGDAPVVSWTTVPITFESLGFVRSFTVTANNEVWLAAYLWSTTSYGAILRGVPTDTPDEYAWAEVLSGNALGGADMHVIWASSSTDLWAIAKGGKSYRGTVAADGGVGWTAFSNPVNSMMTSAWGSGPDDVWAVGSAGAIRHWDGTAWTISKLTVADIPMWQDLTSVHGGPAGDVWAVGNGIALHRAPKSLGGTP